MKRVYFIKPIGMRGPVKIGCSHSPTGRCESLATWAPFPLEVIATIEGDGYIERRFHAAFEHLHERREWFTWAPELQAVIDAVACGEFDTDGLPPPKCVTARADGTPKRWTQFQKDRASLNRRVTAMQRKTGYTALVDPLRAMNSQDEDGVAAVHRYLADPIKHGEPLPYAWAKARAAEYLRVAA